MDYYPLPDEYVLPSVEYTVPDEYANLPKDEFEGRSTTSVSQPKSDHSRLKRLMLMPLAATFAVLSIVFSSFNYDPLGMNFLGGGSSSYGMIPAIPPAEDGEPDGITVVVLHVTYVPTGETYTPASTGEEAMADAVAWVEGKGGAASTMKYIKSETVYTGVEVSDDAVIVGDPDDLDNAYIAQGTVTRKYRRDVYYNAYAIGDDVLIDNSADDAFPKLSNLSPDFEGNYAWGSYGSEEYIRFTAVEASYYTYIEAGGAWKSYGAEVSSVPNAQYDRSTNTLTLNNFTASVLDVNLMGNGFTIRLIGENHLNQLKVWGAYYGGSVTLTGDGSLTVNKNGTAEGGVGINLNGEWSQTCLMIDKDVTLDVYGDYAIVIGATTMQKAIYYLKPLKMTGGTRKAGEFVEYASQHYDANGNYLGETPSTLSEISERDGVSYYDYSVVGNDGMPSKHVRFAP